MLIAPPVQTLPAPAPHMHDLAWFLGEWSIFSRTFQAEPAGTWAEETIFAVHSAELGGNMIWEHFFGPLQGAAYEAWSLRKYDARKDRWFQRWVDSVPGGPVANWTGTWDAGTRSFTGYAEGFLDSEYRIKGERAMREIFDRITPDSFAWRMETTSDGGKTWTVTWTLDYTRVAR